MGNNHVAQNSNCSYCHRSGHSAVFCAFRRRYLKKYFSFVSERGTLLEKEKIEETFSSRPEEISRLKSTPFLINKTNSYIRLFYDLILVIDNKDWNSVHSDLNRVRNHGHLQCSDSWWSDENWIKLEMALERL